MNKLTNTAKKLDIFFRIMQIAFNIAWIGALVGLGILVLGVAFRLDPEMIGTGYGSLEFGFLEFELAEDVIPNKHLILAQVGAVLVLSAGFMLIAQRGIQQVRRILSPMIQGEPFHGVVGEGLKKLAGYSLALGIIGNMAILAEQIFTVLIYDIPTLLLGEKIVHVTYSFEIDLTFLVVAAVLLLTSYVFHYGAQLQQLSDETL